MLEVAKCRACSCVPPPHSWDPQAVHDQLVRIRDQVSTSGVGEERRLVLGPVARHFSQRVAAALAELVPPPGAASHWETQRMEEARCVMQGKGGSLFLRSLPALPGTCANATAGLQELHLPPEELRPALEPLTKVLLAWGEEIHAWASELQAERQQQATAS